MPSGDAFFAMSSVGASESGVSTHDIAQKLAALSTVCDRAASMSAAMPQNQSVSAEEFAA